MNYTFLNPDSQTWDVHIHYIYYEIMGKKDINESLMHAIHYHKIIECLEDKNYTLHKEDIIYLLKDDGAHFYEDSLRIYDQTEQAYFQVTDDWELTLDEVDPSFSLLFYVKSINPNMRKRIDDVTDNLHVFMDQITARMDSLEDRFKSSTDSLSGEVNKLKFSTQVLFQQLAKIYKDNAPATPDDHSSQEGEQTLSIENIRPNIERKEYMPVDMSDSTMYGFSRAESKSSSKEIDIALMYSEPLVRKDQYGIMSLGDPVDYEEECSKLLDILRKKDRKINVYFEIATIRHLVNVLSLSPMVLHIICHGDFNKARNQFFLCFEENGELVELYSEDLKSRLRAVDFSTQLVFINACHSEEVAKVFMDAGVPCVVAVHSELKIEDSIAQRFSESFYWQLFEGRSISEAFRHARAAITGKDVYTCCCAHSHTDDCKWYKLAKEEGFEKAHHLHSPTCTDCSVKFGNKFLHKENCIWAIDFLTSVCEHDELPTGPLKICCCSPNLPHNEVMKFKLICNEKRLKNEVLFSDKEKGEVTIKSTYSCVERKFSTIKMTGRNREIYEMFSLLTSKESRIVNLHGLEGVGKTTLVKQVANYLVERGYFSKDKVCILMLEKTPSVTYFRSNLFKEVPGSYDFKSFCAAIGTAKMLFILQKCDNLIKDYLDQFKQDLAVLMEYAPNVKFLIVTNNKVELGLGERHVIMKELKKLDAAKLLCKNAYLYLPWDQRNVYNLAEHGVFDLIPLTPTGLWSISEKLKDGKSLDEIEMELMEEKEKYDGDSATSELDETIRIIIENIRESHTEAYNMLLFICLFPSGLSFQDLEEASKLGWIAENWKEILFAFLRKKSLSNQYQHQLNDLEDSIDMEGSSSKPLNSKKIERSDFKPDNYVWMHITKDMTNNETWFLPTQFIIKYVEKYMWIDFYRQSVRKLEYLALLSQSLIDKIKKNHDYNERLLEFSAVSTYGIWKVPLHSDEPHDKEPVIKYLENPEFDFSKLKEWVTCHEPNFFSCFDLEILNKMIKENPGRFVQITRLMEVLCLTIPTLEKIMSAGELKSAMEAARRAEQVANRLGKENLNVLILHIKLSLFLVALYLGSKRDVTENFSLAKIQLKLTQEEEETIRDQECSQMVSAEVTFATALYYYKGFKNNCLNTKEFPNKFAVYKEIDTLLKKAEKSLKPMLETNESLKVAKAKLTLAQYKIKYSQRSIEKKYLDDMKEALSVLRTYKSMRLLMKAHYSYASQRLELERKKMGPRMVENSLDYIKYMVSKLVELKNVYLTKIALSIAQKLNDKLYEAKIKRKIDEINMEIRNRYFNVIIIMRAIPLVDIKKTDSTVQISSLGFPTRMVSEFKSNVMDALSVYNKVLCMKFGILGRKELIDSLKSGCRVLQLNCNYAEPDYLCVEGNNGAVDRISFEELQNIFSPKAILPDKSPRIGASPSPYPGNVSDLPSIREGALEEVSTFNDINSRAFSNNSLNHIEDDLSSKGGFDDSLTNIVGAQQMTSAESRMVDVLILGIKNNRRIANLFVEIGIPHIITFEFSSNEANFRYKTFEDQYIDQFSLHLYEELVLQKPVSEAFEIAYNKAFDYINQNFFEGKPQSSVTDIMGKGAILLPQDGDHSEALFSPSRFPLPNGTLEDISNTMFPTNIVKRDAPFTGRHVELYEVIEKINKHPGGVVEVKGEYGIGKTAFALHLGYGLLSRGIFPDGVFYVPLKSLKVKAENGYLMKDLLRDMLGLDVQAGFLSFFKGKNMLLIFDDFNLLYDGGIEFPRLFFHTLKECKISCMVITETGAECSEVLKLSRRKGSEYNSKRISEVEGEFLENVITYELKGFTEEELAYVVLSLITSDNNDSPTLEELKTCGQIQEAKGNPRVVVEALVDGHIQIRDNVLKILPYYEPYILCEEERYLEQEAPSPASFSFSRNPSGFSISDIKIPGRLPSLMEAADLSQPGSRRNSAWLSGLNPEELLKAQSILYENMNADIALSKTLSGGPKRSDSRYRRNARPTRQRKKNGELLSLDAPVMSTGCLPKHEMSTQLESMESPPNFIGHEFEIRKRSRDVTPLRNGMFRGPVLSKTNSEPDFGFKKVVFGGGQSEIEEERKRYEDQTKRYMLDNEGIEEHGDSQDEWESSQDDEDEFERDKRTMHGSAQKVPGRVNGRRRFTAKLRKV